MSAGNGYRVVNLFTEDHASLTRAREVVIKNELKPEKSWNANLNYQKSIVLENTYISIDASAFYTYFTNKIIGDFNSDPNKIIFDNLNGYEISQGVALRIDVMHTSGLQAIVEFTYREEDFLSDYDIRSIKAQKKYKLDQQFFYFRYQ